MGDDHLQKIVLDYQDAFKQRDLAKCMSFFCDDATVKFLFATYKGCKAIAKWHEDRFDANLQLLNLESIQVDRNKVVLNLTATSKRLDTFNIKSMKGTGTYIIENGLIAKVTYSPRRGIASHMDWHFR